MVQFLEMHTERVRRVVAFRRIPHTDENAFAGERVRRADIGRLELEKAASVLAQLRQKLDDERAS
mgnify:CR=1 FL=1